MDKWPANPRVEIRHDPYQIIVEGVDITAAVTQADVRQDFVDVTSFGSPMQTHIPGRSWLEVQIESGNVTFGAAIRQPTAPTLPQDAVTKDDMEYTGQGRRKMVPE